MQSRRHRGQLRRSDRREQSAEMAAISVPSTSGSAFKDESLQIV
jgi:hypothetical protein